MTRPQHNFILRRAEKSDFDGILDIYNHYVLNTALSFDTERQTRSNRGEWFERFFPVSASLEATPSRYVLFVAENSAGKVVGYSASQMFRPKPAFGTSVETSVYCAPDCIGKGLGPALYQTLIAHLKTANVHRAYAFITVPNPASIKLHEQFGYKKAGTLKESGYKQGRYWDVEIFELDFPLEVPR